MAEDIRTRSKRAAAAFDLLKGDYAYKYRFEAYHGPSGALVRRGEDAASTSRADVALDDGALVVAARDQEPVGPRVGLVEISPPGRTTVQATCDPRRPSSRSPPSGGARGRPRHEPPLAHPREVDARFPRESPASPRPREQIAEVADQVDRRVAEVRLLPRPPRTSPMRATIDGDCTKHGRPSRRGEPRHARSPLRPPGDRPRGCPLLAQAPARSRTSAGRRRPPIAHWLKPSTQRSPPFASRKASSSSAASPPRLQGCRRVLPRQVSHQVPGWSTPGTRSASPRSSGPCTGPSAPGGCARRAGCRSASYAPLVAPRRSAVGAESYRTPDARPRRDRQVPRHAHGRAGR